MASTPSTADTVEHLSPSGFDATVERLTQAIGKAGLQVFATIDHAGAARAVGLAMPPTKVLIYGNPRGGTPLMQAVPLVALDLPLHVLVREDAAGRTRIAFHPIVALLARAGLPEAEARRLEAAQQLLIAALAS